MAKKYIMLDLDDERISSLGDVLGNKTSKKIINYLSDKEANETEISRDLKIPANTVNYNVKKLLESGLIEKSKEFFWSVKGKKIPMYRVANKKIVISPKSSSSFIAVVGSLVAVGAGAVLVKFYAGFQAVSDSVSEKVASGGGAMMAESVAPTVDSIVEGGCIAQEPNLWIWFLIGGFIALAVFIIINLIRKK